MTLHLHHLTGCTPVPLAGYLKGLGILRVVAEQKDPDARGWWQDEHFCLLTTCDATELRRFFLEEYSPSPFVSPWNKGSGFYTVSDPGLTPLEQSSAARFASFRDGIAASRSLLAGLSAADARIRELKARTKSTAKEGVRARESARALRDDPAYRSELAAAERRFKELKANLFELCQRTWRGRHRQWLDAAVVILDTDEQAWPSILGTGGNDGRLDFTNNAMQRIGELFDMEDAIGRPGPDSGEWLDGALWGGAANNLSQAAVGQFLPGSAGGANSTTGPEGEATVNAWDFVLMMEGTLLLRAAATKRLDRRTSKQGSAPFAVRAQDAGYGSRGGELSRRGEQWLPLWSTATSLSDLDAMFGEARIQLGRQAASTPIDVARAVQRLGTARGLQSFVRYGYLERNGQSNIAVPLARVKVRDHAAGRLIDDVAQWLDRLGVLVRDEQAVSRLRTAYGALADAVFSALSHDDEPWRWQAVLLAAVEVEQVQASGTAVGAGRIPPLSAGWLQATNDGSPEWRLACALGSAAAPRRDGRRRDSVRRHWLPLDGARFLMREKRLARTPDVVGHGRDAVADLTAVVMRRLQEAAREGGRHLPLVAAPGFGAMTSDISLWLSGSLDDNKVLRLARAFMAIRWAVASTLEWSNGRHATENPQWPEEAWLAIRLACLPWPLDDAHAIPVDEAIVARLASGDAPSACDVALRRLRAAGLRPVLRAACADSGLARRWSAALAFPISHSMARQMAMRLDSNAMKEIR